MTGPPTAHFPHQHQHAPLHAHPLPLHGHHSEVAGQGDRALPAVLEDSANRGTVVLSSVSSDAHTWNLVYLQLLLEELGWHVVNLGACTPDQVVIDACLSHRPNLVVISSVNGHGHLDGARLAEALRGRPELRTIPAIIGGKLGVSGEVGGAHVHTLLEAGFDAVFEDGTDMRLFTGYVAALGERRYAVAP